MVENDGEKVKKAKLHVLKKSKRLKPFLGDIEATAQNALEKIEKTLALPPLDVVIADNPDSAIPEIGIGGSSPHEHLILVWIDPEFPGIKDTIENKISRTIAHECMHATRSVFFPWGEATLLEAFITEGLADHFDIEMNGGDPHPWSVALDKEELKKYFKMAESELMSKNDDHSKWFFGSDEGIPRWAGYAIGYEVVGNYLKKTEGKSSEVVDLPAEEFITTIGWKNHGGK